MQTSKYFQFVLLSVGLSLIAISCKDDDDDNTPTPVVYDNYTQLKVGNYWIYQRFDVDSSGTSTPTAIYDSCYIEKDTIIAGFTYYKMIRPSLDPQIQSKFFVKDSLHYYVEEGGKILFSSLDFTNTFDDYYITASSLSDTICRVVKKMTEKDFLVSTPGGTFQTSNCQSQYQMYPNWAFAGALRFLNTRFAKDVGIVTETLPFFASTPNHVERRLVHYHLN